MCAAAAAAVRTDQLWILQAASCGQAEGLFFVMHQHVFIKLDAFVGVLIKRK
jgi:hypothetical protein